MKTSQLISFSSDEDIFSQLHASRAHTTLPFPQQSNRRSALVKEVRCRLYNGPDPLETSQIDKFRGHQNTDMQRESGPIRPSVKMSTLASPHLGEDGTADRLTHRHEDKRWIRYDAFRPIMRFFTPPADIFELQ